MWLSLLHKNATVENVTVEMHDGEEVTKHTYVRDDIVSEALLYTAVDMDLTGCKDDWCEPCNPARRAWWNACNALGREARIELQGLLRDAAISLPKGPFESEQ